MGTKKIREALEHIPEFAKMMPTHEIAQDVMSTYDVAMEAIAVIEEMARSLVRTSETTALRANALHEEASVLESIAKEAP